MHILSQGAIFGELLLSEEKRAFTAVAGTDALVTVLSKASLEELLASVPAHIEKFHSAALESFSESGEGNR